MDLEKLRHSAAHVLASAVKELYPDVKLGIGPVIEDGFYYDFGDIKLTEEDLPRIEKKMQEIIKKNYEFKLVKKTKEDIKKLFKTQQFKLDLLKDLEKPTLYQHGDFIDLCRGNHLNFTGDIKAFKLLRLAGAYWMGDSKNPMLQRVYGTAFETKEELDKYLKMLEEAEKRDHKKIAREMELYILSEMVGKGLPLWLPKGEILKKEIENFALETEKKYNYLRVSTPHLGKKELYIASGHLPYYAESMYPSMKLDDGEYYLKAMNCPHHHLIYKHKPKSYRDLPVRLAEYGTVYRNELSGVLSGLLRVRMLSMNDAHIYCRKDQIKDEIKSILEMIKYYYGVFGFKDYWFRLSLSDLSNKEKYFNDPENWSYSENVLREVLKELKVKFTESKNEAAFYGPKIDVQFKTVTGREETMSTIQLDFAAKKRFDLSYTDKDGKENNNVFVIHRAPLSTHERFVAFLIENCAGKFPLWLNPVQVKMLTLTDRNIKYANEVLKKLDSFGIRVELDDENETMNKKVREAQLERVSYIVTVGDKEEKANTLAVRTLDGNVKFGVKVDDFINELLDKIKNKK